MQLILRLGGPEGTCDVYTLRHFKFFLIFIATSPRYPAQRFDREVSIDAPTELTRHRILESQTRTMPLADDVDIGKE